MTIHRALTELEMLHKRIEEAHRNVTAVVARHRNDKKVNGIEVEEFVKNMQSSYDKVVGLIAYRNRLKALVVESNARAVVKVGSREMNVVEAIERKQSIEYEKTLLATLLQQYNITVKRVAKNNDELPEKLETYLINILGNKEKQTPEEVALHTDTFMKRNEQELLDPLKVKKVIEAMEGSVNEFKSEVDAVLSESNAKTFIELMH